MNNATLVIMAAGIGSRFGGGIKQLEPVGQNGEIIMDYSIYDAIQAGFNKVVFVIRKNLEEDFKAVIGNRIEKIIKVEYAYQEIEDIPTNYKSKFKNRTKPWGTGQAILVCKNVINEPFLVINADDYYGKEAFIEAFNYLMNITADEICMVGFTLGNTLSDNGGVTRGLCQLNDQSYLVDIKETKNIIKVDNQAMIEGSNDTIDLNTAVSMNMWGLSPNFINKLEKGFNSFLSNLQENDLTSEYLLPTIIGESLDKNELKVKVLESKDAWFGVTYKEDKEVVVAAIKELVIQEKYPINLFEK